MAIRGTTVTVNGVAVVTSFSTREDAVAANGLVDAACAGSTAKPVGFLLAELAAAVSADLVTIITLFTDVKQAVSA